LAGIRTIVDKRATGVTLALAGLALAGCTLPSRMAGLSDAPVDSSSPVAQDVIRASQHPGPYPKFADIPPIPKDVRSASGWRAAVQEVQQREATLTAQVAALPPVSTDTDAYAEQARKRLGAPPRPPAPEDAAAETAAYGRALRERATPPPPPK